MFYQNTLFEYTHNHTHDLISALQSILITTIYYSLYYNKLQPYCGSFTHTIEFINLWRLCSSFDLSVVCLLGKVVVHERAHQNKWARTSEQKPISNKLCHLILCEHVATKWLLVSAFLFNCLTSSEAGLARYLPCDNFTGIFQGFYQLLK